MIIVGPKQVLYTHRFLNDPYDHYVWFIHYEITTCLTTTLRLYTKNLHKY